MPASPLMRVRIHGAAGEVTGSCHLVECLDRKVLLDCGLIQGGREEAARNAAGFGFDAAAIDAVVVSHAHIDHIGRLPLLVKRGFRGPIHATPATIDLARIMLEDSASLAAADAERENRHRQARGEAPTTPLYGLREVADTLRLMRALPYGEPAQLFPGIDLDFENAGHILGAASVRLRATRQGQQRSLVFSGDIGPANVPILHDPTPRREADLVLLESTYGDRLHRSRAATVAELGAILDHARRDGGNVLIPAFAVGRSQEILYWLARHYEEWNLDEWKIYLDSPMATKVISVYQRHADLFDGEAAALRRAGKDPFRLPNLRLISDVQDSMALNRRAEGCIIIAGSGMCTGGRIRHHLRHNLARPNTDILFVGYQAQGTLGRKLVDGADSVRLFGETIPVRAQRHTIGGLSAHADQAGLLDWYGHFRNRPRVALIHGEDRQRQALDKQLRERFGVEALLPKPRAVIDL
ncbi:MAG: MBL fold metallo-hydrolase [Lysobacteraceae bacterium]